MTKNIISVAVNKPLYQTFDYRLPVDCAAPVGARVTVPFGHRDVIGIVLEHKQTSSFPATQLKTIKTVLDEQPILTDDILQLCQWAANYYHHPIGEVLFNAIPNALRKKAGVRKKAIPLTERTITPCNIKLNDAQQKAIETIQQSLHQFQCFLLNGVTGSGKTEVYIRLMHEILNNDKQAMVLVPEIGLTPQLVDRFKKRFSETIVCLHSALTDVERLHAFQQAKSGEAKIIIGTRSAIFTPCKNLGLIVIDEEQDSSLKQESGFRYSARDLAVMRAQFNKTPIILGSATPSFATLKNARTKRYQILTLPERAGKAIHPTFHTIDLRGRYLENGLSNELLTQIRQHLNNNNQVLIFLNRRGFSPTVMCHHCGFVATCHRCDARLTLHQGKNPHLLCHHCETKQPFPKQCPQCQQEALHAIGVGTERLENALQQFFPDTPIIRIDRDSTRQKNALQDLWEKIHDGHRQILIGTQMLAKGHHFPNVTLVAVINIDGGFFSADFRATEQMGQLLMQVAGRAGRAEKSGEVYIQTYHPQHPLLLELIRNGYNGFADLELKAREEAHLPPYRYFALLHAKSHKINLAENFLDQIKAHLQQNPLSDVQIMGPIPSPMQKKQGYFRAELLFQSTHRKNLHETLSRLIDHINNTKTARQVRWSLDIQ